MVILGELKVSETDRGFSFLEEVFPCRMLLCRADWLLSKKKIVKLRFLFDFIDAAYDSFSKTSRNIFVSSFSFNVIKTIIF